MDLKKQLAKETSKLFKETEKAEEPTENHPLGINNYQDGNYYKINLDQITPDPNQPRKHFNEEALKELSESIKNNGVLQPIIIRKDQNKIILIAGERRYRASKMAGLTQIPAILSTGKPAEIALIENIQREDLKPLEEAVAFNKMIDEHKYTHEQLSFVVGKSRTTVTEILSLKNLSHFVRTYCPPLPWERAGVREVWQAKLTLFQNFS